MAEHHDARLAELVTELAVIRHAEVVTGNVAQTCRYFGITRQTFYVWLRRYQLRDKSRRPTTVPTPNPDVEVETVDGRRFVTGRAAHGLERERLWARWGEIDENLDGYAALRSKETAVVVLEPRSEAKDEPGGV
jgi:transposase-like protein